MNSPRFTCLFLLVFLLIGCGSVTPEALRTPDTGQGADTSLVRSPTQELAEATAAPIPTQVPRPAPSALPPLGYTHHRADGNRFIDGAGALPSAEPLDIPLGAKPLWVTAVPLEEGALWAVVLDSFFTQAFMVVGSE